MAETLTAPSQRRYKPVPLRWPFLVVQMVLVAAAIVAIVLLQTLLPDSDDSAFVDGHRPRARRNFASQPQTTHQISQRNSASQTHLTVITCAAVGPSATGTCLTTISINTSVLSVGGRKPAGKFNKPPAPHPTQLSVDPSWTQPAYNTSAATTSSKTLARGPGDHFDPNGQPTEVADLPMTMVSVTPITEIDDSRKWTTGLFGGPNGLPDAARGSATSSTSLETQTIITTVGSTPTTMVAPEVVRTGISTVEATVVTMTETPPPTTVVLTSDGTLVSTVVTPPPQPMVTTLSASVVTFVETKPPETVVTTMGGSAVTLVAVITPGVVPGKPTTETVVSEISGTPVTLIRVFTPLPPITTAIETTVDGKLTTMSLTLIPMTTAIATTINGTPTTVSLTLTLTPTATPTTPPGSGKPFRQDNITTLGENAGTRVYTGVTPSQYFAGTFLPPLIAVLLAFPISTIELNVKLLQPFRALTTTDGAAGPDSMTLRYVGIDNVIIPVRQLLRGEPIPFLASLLMWLSWLLAPLAVEAVGFKVHGACSHLSISGCALALGVSPWPTRALIAVLAIMLVILVALAVLLHRWDTGVSRNPWSMADAALLSRDPHLHDRLSEKLNGRELSDANLADIFRHGRFHLERLPLADTHGLTMAPAIVPDWGTPFTPTSLSLADQSPTQRPNPFPVLTYTARVFFLFLLLGLMTLLIYYHLLRSDTPFELFMDSQAFGVKFLFAAIGSLLALFWSSFFLSLGAMTPFRSLSISTGSDGDIRSRAMSQPPPTNPFTGAYHASRNRQWLLLSAAMMALAGELLPAFLANIPYALTQTWNTHRLSTYASLTILSAMVVVLAASMCVTWPYLPVDPRTMAGMVYYVSGSEALREDVVRAEGRAAEEKGVGRGRGLELGGKYCYGRVDGSDGKGRMAVYWGG
ncbi:hypothetical protein B0T16DRAFT_450599 [Cercophora newfieldiana]|uniref:Uncharacterized protein n=1 Tax=Cercophora newfieldiana TaxID=92897 RepID=A0AA39YLN6_9PEZI|nr:hypothetical protein B0T16DRAFT_450599 [Cercophora newfieldiana]